MDSNKVESFNGIFKWSEWLRAYELMDPEPALRFENDSQSHYSWPDVVAHAEWHRRMTDYYMRNTV